MAKKTVKKVAKPTLVPAAKKTVKKVAAPVKAEKTAKAPKITRNTGKTSGLKIAQYQDKLLKENTKNKFSDEKLAKLMRDEFPDAVAYTVEHVRGMRSAWNNGNRASQEGVAPEKPVKEYNDAGEVVERRRGPAAKAEGGAKKTVKKGVKKAAKPPVEDEEDEEEDVDESDEDESEEDDEE